MKPRRIKDRIWLVGAIDWERRIFDSLIPIPHGTTYNSYLVQGSERTALIDTVDPSKAAALFGQLEEVPRLDYVVANHAEPDHSGAVPAVLERYREARLVATPKAKPMLMNLLGVAEERFQTVEDGASISLGDKTLTFLHMPWVHWPETMVTYLPEDRILFSCDLFGSHYASNDTFVSDRAAVNAAAKQYYAEIMMPFRAQIARHLDRLAQYDVDVIAPSHGPAYEEPALILNAYRDWVLGGPKNLVAIIYISMHGSTRKMVDCLVSELTEHEIPVELFDVTTPEIDRIAVALVDAATILIGTPTVLGGPHPNVLYAAYLASILRPKARFATIVGPILWGTKVVERISEMLGSLKLELLEPVLCKGAPKPADYQALKALAAAIAERHKRGLQA